jgi:hypothetical protein
VHRGPDGGLLLERVETAARTRGALLDADMRRRRGIVHTPAAIARFVARAADDALRSVLGRPEGLGAPDVVIVDPATGLGIFLAACLEVAAPRFTAPRALVGIDIDSEACRLAQEMLTTVADAAGWPLRIAHADTLAGPAPVRELEDDDVIRVILGNPPWAGRFTRPAARYCDALLDDFRRDGQGRPLAERRIGVLSDEYIRFTRWALELARRARRGAVIALVTNGSFLDGPVHRGMRAAMERWLDRIDVVDLGGSSLIARDGLPDENVFGVRPRVAITVGVRGPGPEPRSARIAVAVLRGRRDEKLARLEGADSPRALGPIAVASNPTSPGAAWRARPAVPAAYETWPSLAAWMPFHREGLQTNRDELVTDPSRDALRRRLARFAAGDIAARPTAHWDPVRARAAARELLDDPPSLERACRRIAYRPLEERWAIVHPALCHRPRPELGRAVDASAFVLITARKDRGQLRWACFGASRWLPDNCWLSTRSSCRARAFPLVDPEGAPNLDRALAARTEDRIGAPFPAERFALWALAWMASPAYRATCDGALRADYPRIPAPRSAVELERVEAAGARLLEALTDPSAAAAPLPTPPPPVSLRIGHHDLGGAGARARAIALALAELAAVVDPLVGELLGVAAEVSAPSHPDP